MTAASLRPMLPTDVPMLAAVFRASIGELAVDDYNDDQREAWAARAEDEASFGTALAGHLTLVALVDGRPAGFASLAGTDTLAMLYVAPDHARQGVASMLLDALVRLASARGAAKLTVDASDTAVPFFAARGFSPTMRNMRPVGEEWLGNTTMQRVLGTPGAARP